MMAWASIPPMGTWDPLGKENEAGLRFLGAGFDRFGLDVSGTA